MAPPPHACRDPSCLLGTDADHLARAPRTRHVVGVMTGTSMDGLDAALVRVNGRGLALTATLLRHESSDFPPALRQALRAAAEQQAMTSGSLATLARDFALFHGEAIGALLRAAACRADLIVAHGQTVFHAPPVSWQLLQPAPIVAALGVTTVCDLRQADLAIGGQGAPITPLADWVLFRGERDRAIVNLGGFCNITLVPRGCAPEAIRGADVCACNQVLDAVARDALGSPFDTDGAAAARGRPDTIAVDGLVAILRAQRGAGRSLGTGDEAGAWVSRERQRLSPDDVAASAAEAVGRVIGEAPRAAGFGTDAEVFLAGGGARHRPLAAAIARSSGATVRPLDAIGVPIDAREAMEMAILGVLAEDEVAITLAGVTGRGPVRVCDGLWCFAKAREPE